MAITWSNITGIMTRDGLDARKSDTLSFDGRTISEELDNWGKLAARFNDYLEFQPQNIYTKYEFCTDNNSPKQVIPYQPTDDSTLLPLFNKCKELNPTDFTRKHIIRDSGWLKSIWSKLRGYLHQIYADFDRSGKNRPAEDASIDWFSEEEQKRWVYHCGNKSRMNEQVKFYLECNMNKYLPLYLPSLKYRQRLMFMVFLTNKTLKIVLEKT